MKKLVLSILAIASFTSYNLSAQDRFLADNIFPDTGYAGIGTVSPSAELEIQDDTSPHVKIKSTAAGLTGWVDLGMATCDGCFSNAAKEGDAVLRAYPIGTNDNIVFSNRTPSGGFVFAAGAGTAEIAHVFIDNDGRMGVGTDSFTDGSIEYKLSVDGRIRAEGVKVYNSWADFVFEDSYDLPTLKEVEAYIAANGHLKDIPSAATVAEEGIDLGEMNKLLLQKVEELTLYVIDLNKQVELLKQ